MRLISLANVMGEKKCELKLWKPRNSPRQDLRFKMLVLVKMRLKVLTARYRNFQ